MRTQTQGVDRMHQLLQMCSVGFCTEQRLVTWMSSVERPKDWARMLQKLKYGGHECRHFTICLTNKVKLILSTCHLSTTGSGKRSGLIAITRVVICLMLTGYREHIEGIELSYQNKMS